MSFHQSFIKKKGLNFKVNLNPFSFLTIPFVLILVFFVILPFLFVIFYSFANIQENFISLTIDNFVRFANDPSFWVKLWRSVYFAGFSTIFCLIFGYPIAYFIARTKPSVRNWIVILITLPMWVNMLLRVIGLRALFQMFTSWTGVNIIGTDFALIFGETYTSLPFMIIPIYTQILKIDPTLLEASKDLGCSSGKSFFKVTLPNSMPGVISGITMVFLPSATSIVVPKYMGGGKPEYNLIGNLIENYFVKQNKLSEGSAMAIIMCLVVLLIIFFVRFLDQSEVKNKLSPSERKKSLSKGTSV